MVAQVPLTPATNKGLSYVNGLGLTYVSTTSFTVAQGQCRDSTGKNDLILARPPLNDGTEVTTAFTCSLALSGAGGLDTGTIAASKLYYVFVIGSSADGWIDTPPSQLQSLSVPPFTSPAPTAAVVQSAYYIQNNVLISLSKTAPLLPFGFDMFRRVGCISTDASSHVAPFLQTGTSLNRTMWYDSGTLDATHVGLAIPSSATIASQTLATIGVLTTLVPQTAIECLVYGGLVANAAGDSLLLTPKGFTAAVAAIRTNATGTVVGEVVRVPCNFNGATPSIVEIDYATSSATATVAFTLPGYVDQL